MNKLELVKVETDTTKVYKPHDKFTFKLVFNNQQPIDDDLEFEVLYFGDAYSENHDQKICHNVIGPLEAGKLSFELETSPIDLTKIPIKTLFGLTTILIIGKFHGEQFIRIGYVLDVKHHGIDSEKLIEVDEQPLDEEDDEVEDDSADEVTGEDDESIEIDDGEECGDDECENVECCDEECENEECCGEDCENEECCGEDCENEECCGEECEGEEEDSNEEFGLENAIADALLPKRAAIPLETPIVAGQDEFEYKGMKLYQSKIEMTLLDKPIIQVYEIDWNLGEKNEIDEVVESSENETNHESCDKKDLEPSAKKQRVE